jgi:hypothetical protein
MQMATNEKPDPKEEKIPASEVGISVGFDTANNTVILNFGEKPICWLALSVEEARDLILLIQESTEKVDN